MTIILQKKIKYKKIVIYNLSFFYLILLILFNSMPIFERIVEFGSIFISIFMYSFLKNIKKKKEFIFVFGIITLFIVKLVIATYINAKTNQVLHKKDIRIVKEIIDKGD